MWTLIFKVRTPHPFYADLKILRSAHTLLADLNTAKISGATSLTPPENGAGKFLGRSKCQHFPGKTVFPSGASRKKNHVYSEIHVYNPQ